jgi:predicted MFS family arabinose efflux permease
MLSPLFASYREAYSGIPRPVWLLSAANLINRSGTMVLPFLALYLTEERGFSVTGAGRALALYGVGAMAASFLGGWLADRFEPVRVMTWSLVATAACFFVLGRLEAPWAIYLALAALSLAGESFRPANLTAIGRASGEVARAKSYTLYRLAINLGMTLGPTVGGVLALYDYDWLFWADGATCLGAALLLHLAFRPTAGERAEERPAGAGRSPWSDRPFLAFGFLCFVVAAIMFQILGAFPLFLSRERDFSEAAIGFVLAINTLIIVAVEMVVVHTLSRRDIPRILAAGGLLVGLGFALLPFGRGFLFVAFTVVVWTLGEMLSFSFSTTWTAARADDWSRGRYLGVYNLNFATAFVVAPLLGTWVYERFGGTALWLGCGVAGVAVALGFVALGRRPH